MNKTHAPLTALIATIVIGILTIIAPIAWDYAKNHSQLQLQLLSQSVLIEKEKGLDKLRVFYDDQEVQKLTRFSFLLMNAGRTPILQQDLVSPPRIVFTVESKILEFKTESLSYDNLQVTYTPNAENNVLSISSPLLNPNDHIQFSILVEGADPAFHCDARVKNIKELQYVDRRSELTSKRSRVSWLVYPVGFFTIMFAIVPFGMIGDAKKVRKVKARFLDGSEDIPTYTNSDDYIRFLADEFHDIMGTARLKTAFDLLPSKELSPKQIGRIRAELKQLLDRADSTIGGIIVSVVFAALGLWYIINQII